MYTTRESAHPYGPYRHVGSTTLESALLNNFAYREFDRYLPRSNVQKRPDRTIFQTREIIMKQEGTERKMDGRACKEVKSAIRLSCAHVSSLSERLVLAPPRFTTTNESAIEASRPAQINESRDMAAPRARCIALDVARQF